jgi:putative flippase GtrA
MLSRTAIFFVLASAAAAACNFASRIVFSLFVPYLVAVILAFVVGLTTAFWLNRRFVFGREGPALRQFGRFFAVNLFALLQTILISMLLLHYALPALGWQWHAAELAHAAGIAAPMFSSYFAHKHLTFRAQRAP